MLIDVDVLYCRGWESDADCEVWWKKGKPETTYSFAEAADILEDWLVNP